MNVTCPYGQSKRRKGNRMFIVIYKTHGSLNIDTAHIGPFPSWGEAYEYLCMLPALGICPEGENPGHKYIKELMAPDMDISRAIASL